MFRGCGLVPPLLAGRVYKARDASNKINSTVRFFIIDSENLENVLKDTFEKMSCELRHENLRAKFEKPGVTRAISPSCSECPSSSLPRGRRNHFVADCSVALFCFFSSVFSFVATCSLDMQHNYNKTPKAQRAMVHGGVCFTICCEDEENNGWASNWSQVFHSSCCCCVWRQHFDHEQMYQGC